MRTVLAAAVLAFYGWSVGDPIRVLAAGAVAWGLSLAVLVPMSQRPAREVLDHGAVIMLAGALPLAPLALANAFSPSTVANVVVLALDGALMLALMAARLRQTWNSCVWLAVLEAVGLSTWALI
jgi:hypothetical protein